MHSYRRPLIDSALALLGVRRLAIAVHDSCFPSTPDEDIGRGSPYGRGGADFFQFARSLGFNAVQFGPQTKTSADDPSPYNGAIFSKNILSLAARSLADDPRTAGLVSAADCDRLISQGRSSQQEKPLDQADHAQARQIAEAFLSLVYTRFRKIRGKKGEFVAAFERYVAAQQAAPVSWFERDGVFEALAHLSGTDDWRLWGMGNDDTLPLDRRLYCPEAGEEEACRRRIKTILRQQRSVIERFALGQFLLHLQHQRMRQETQRLGLRLYGDMHIGGSHQDGWAWQSLFLHSYLLGAPPSRTTLAGQPWGYPILHPHLLHTVEPDGKMIRGPAVQFLRARAQKMLADFDGVRIDHPQGLVCPWVYRTDDPDPFHAVQHGARLYCSPNDPDHPELRRYAIARPEQLNPDPNYPHYGDEYVRELAADQVERYAVALDTILDEAAAAGGRVDDVMCEVLSTWPMPLRTVMQQRGMGRFCITQKADPHNPNDVYRPERTSPGDWIMVGNHDTKPLWLVAEERQSSDWMLDRSRLLAERLAPATVSREEFAVRVASDPRRFCEAMFAELFLGPARNISIFFADLLGERQLYNLPGSIGEHNWTLRMPSNYREVYAQRTASGDAMNIPRVLAMALDAKAAALGSEAVGLAEKLRNGA